jgi:hypothetical protein
MNALVPRNIKGKRAFLWLKSLAGSGNRRIIAFSGRQEAQVGAGEQSGCHAYAAMWRFARR